jgi:prepilin-type N-terminal cleavage/methylation domain-containing protein
MLSAARRAFTLVELLVVMGIISLLISLLMVGILAGLAYARQVQCADRLKNQALALTMMATTKGYFPGYAATVTAAAGTSAQRQVDIGWAPQLFDYLDMQERRRRLAEWHIAAGQPSYLEHIELFTCPSDPPDFESPFWSETECGGPVPAPAPTIAFPLSYAVSAGRPDKTIGQPDDIRYALFHDRRDGVMRVDTTLTDITDGATNTLAIVENVDLVNWSSVSETHQGVVWLDAPSVLLNQNLLVPYDCDRDGLADNLDYAHARPSSHHQDGFNAAYADARVHFFSIDRNDPAASYDLYRRQMTPANAD